MMFQPPRPPKGSSSKSSQFGFSARTGTTRDASFLFVVVQWPRLTLTKQRAIVLSAWTAKSVETTGTSYVVKCEAGGHLSQVSGHLGLIFLSAKGCSLFIKPSCCDLRQSTLSHSYSIRFTRVRPLPGPVRLKMAMRSGALCQDHQMGPRLLRPKTLSPARPHASFSSPFFFPFLVSHEDLFNDGSSGCGWGRCEVAGVGRCALFVLSHHAASRVLPWILYPDRVTSALIFFDKQNL